MNPVCADIERNTENSGIGHATPADPIARFQQDKATIRSRDSACRRNPRGTRANDHYVSLNAGLRAQNCRPCDKSRGTGNE
jgi:hypothetical protein